MSKPNESGIKLPPISFLSSLNNPQPSTSPPRPVAASPQGYVAGPRYSFGANTEDHVLKRPKIELSTGISLPRPILDIDRRKQNEDEPYPAGTFGQALPSVNALPHLSQPFAESSAAQTLLNPLNSPPKPDVDDTIVNKSLVEDTIVSKSLVEDTILANKSTNDDTQIADQTILPAHSERQDILDRASSPPATKEDILNGDARSGKGFVRAATTYDNSDILTFIQKFPRRHLGAIMYTSKPTPESLPLHLNLTPEDLFRMRKRQKAYRQKESGTVRVIPLLPVLSNYLNCLIDIKIPYHYLLQKEEIWDRRQVWGTQIYTDDSDVLNILKHMGVFGSFNPYVDRIARAEETEEATCNDFLRLDVLGAVRKSIQYNLNLKKALVKSGHVAGDSINNNHVIGDLTVTLLVLPPLTAYHGRFQNGINSRLWTESPHNGMSIAVYGISFENLNESAADSHYYHKQGMKEVEEVKVAGVRTRAGA
ncbi:hypothetical protein BABINDRAFT_161886 [Babjeviella inositovora NRRL Y-12698]|uniref:Uncharacterized protein n=1 Tax=Babjeviella inositovora NRRL Y-12698 TaxID=984486 RepID=A0A1E3QP55_9ASCO|nr:uncharacterized protein BABINDRAFT_161886 [Babjeviella inositovora NRRL Y-12698]ODQ79489.1 hypothetical protein BABINDRAFT_161886 [Babjeviella inositovora NRRL Y-12698]